MNIQALIFDLDGTLLYTLQDIAKSANLALAACGHATHPEEDYLIFVGSGMEILFRRALLAEEKGMSAVTQDLDTVGSISCSDDEVHAVLAAMNEIYAIHSNDHTRPYDGIMDTLNTLKSMGIRLAILSNKPDGFTKDIAAQHFAPDIFDFVEGAKPDVPRKPAPDAALTIAKAWNLAPEHIAYVGDSDIDVATGLRAGMLAVACAWGFQGREKVQAAGAQVILDEPSGFLSLIK
ncbi:MAG: HAD family hydrolase [Pseudomonadota bacterium]